MFPAKYIGRPVDLFSAPQPRRSLALFSVLKLRGLGSALTLTKIVSLSYERPRLLVTRLHLVVISTIFYWYIIEAGFAIIAACMPSLRFLFANRSLQSVVHRFRNAVSLRSDSTRQHAFYTDIESTRPINHIPQIYGLTDIPTETNVVGGDDKNVKLHTLPRAGQIQVERGILQTRGNA